jgi:hypothetical protein
VAAERSHRRRIERRQRLPRGYGGAAGRARAGRGQRRRPDAVRAGRRPATRRRESAVRRRARAARGPDAGAPVAAEESGACRRGAGRAQDPRPPPA